MEAMKHMCGRRLEEEIFGARPNLWDGNCPLAKFPCHVGIDAFIDCNPDNLNINSSFYHTAAMTVDSTTNSQMLAA